jgi:hypothetical protein
VYLVIAASLGFSALIQVDEPNIVTALARKKWDIVEVPRHPGPESVVSKTRLAAATEDPVPKETAMAELEKKMRLLSARADRITVELGQMRELLTPSQTLPLDARPGATSEKQPVALENPVSARGGGQDGGGNTKAIAELKQEVRLLSDKVDHILEALGRMANYLPSHQEDLQKDQATVEEKVLD